MESKSVISGESSVQAVKWPTVLERSVQRFTTFYSSQHSGRKLHWLYNMSKGELVTRCFKNRYSLQYSKMKDKLYIGRDVPCPVNFSTNTRMTDDVCIRAMALFSSAEHASEIVHRCVNHSMAELRNNLPEAEHLVRCESASAVYVNDKATGRHSVIVPFENPPAGQQFSSYIYKFACLGSCSGGPNRRSLMLVFTLERGGSVIGRKKVDLKVCACPSRDMKADEKQMTSTLIDKKPIKRKSHDSDIPSKRISLTPGSTVDSVPNFHTAVKKIRPVPETGPYNIKVHDKSCYEFLKLMKKCFFMYLSTSSNTNDHQARNRAVLNFIRSLAFCKVIKTHYLRAHQEFPVSHQERVRHSLLPMRVYPITRPTLNCV